MPTLMDSLKETSRPKTGQKKKVTEKAKRVSQRGMGVAKLEAQRKLQELTGSNQFLHGPLNQYCGPCSYPGFVSFGSMSQVGFNPSGLGLVSPVCGPIAGAGHFGYYTGDGYGFGAPGEMSRELPSFPNLNQYSENWGFSNKKKRVNDDHSLGFNGCSIFGLNLDENQLFGARREEYRVKSPSLKSYLGGNNDQEGEVLSVHMKGNSTILTEYEFFPGYKNDYRDTYHQNNTDPKDNDGTSSPFLTTTTTSMGSIIYAPKPIDLSLKLSY